MNLGSCQTSGNRDIFHGFTGIMSLSFINGVVALGFTGILRLSSMTVRIGTLTLAGRIAAARREALEREIAELKTEAEGIAEDAREGVVLTGSHQTSSISIILNSLTA